MLAQAGIRSRALIGGNEEGGRPAGAAGEGKPSRSRRDDEPDADQLVEDPHLYHQGGTEAEPAVKPGVLCKKRLGGGERWPGCPNKEKPQWGPVF